MLSAAMRTTKPAKPEQIKKELPKNNNSHIISRMNQDETCSKPIGYMFDDMHFGSTPPNKFFMENLKNRLDKF